MLIILGLAAGCGKAPPGGPEEAGSAIWFEDVTARAGIVFTHEVTVSGDYLFSESIGSGAAFLDFDNDGRLDVYLIHNVGPAARVRNRLLHQQTDGKFADV